MARKLKSQPKPDPKTRVHHCTPASQAAPNIKLPVLPPDKPRVQPSRAGKWRAWSLFCVHVLMVAHFYQWMLAGKTISPVEPSESMETITTGRINAGFIFFAAALLATLILGRWVCGWGCHLVAYQDLTLWVLKKLKLRPKAFATRLFWLIPLVAALFMFVWPEIGRLILGTHRPPMTWHVTTTGFWDTFPQYGIAILTVVMCGGAMIYFLGPKGFCTFACPYGAFFGLTDKLAVGRIRVTDACHECGHCTSVCTSNVRVAEEVKLYKMVVDPGCMKCMDCVTVCPNDALYFGFGGPAIGHKPAAPQPKRRFDLSLEEEVFALALFFCVFLAYRGLYAKFPFLMSLGIAGVITFLIMKAAKLAHAPDVLIQRTRLKVAGHIKPMGYAYLAVILAIAALTIHSGIWRYHDWQGNSAFESSPPEALGWQFDPLRSSRLSDTQFAAIDTGLRHLEFCEQWGLYAPPDNELKRAWLYVCGDRLPEATDCLRRVIARHPDDFSMWMHLGRVLTANGALADARAAFEKAIQLESQRRQEWTRKLGDRPMEGTSRLWTEWGMFLEHCGDADTARSALAFAQQYDPGFVNAALAMGRFQLRMDNIDAARSAFIDAILMAPTNPEAHDGLRAITKAQQHFDRAVEEYRAAIVRNPDITSLRHNLAYSLAQLERYDEAAAEYRKAIELLPNAWETRADYGAVLLVLRDSAGAIDQYQQIFKAEPTNAEAAIRLAYLYLQMGNNAAAAPLIDVAMKYGNDDQRATALMFSDELSRRKASQAPPP